MRCITVRENKVKSLLKVVFSVESTAASLNNQGWMEEWEQKCNVITVRNNLALC